MIEILASLFLLSGALLMLLAAIGVLRLPDLYTRMHAATKVSSLGMLLLLIALNIYYFSVALLLKSIFIIIFIFATIPVASHMIGGAGHVLKIKKWHNTKMDEWEEEEV